MTDLEAHVIVTHMGTEMRQHLRDFARGKAIKKVPRGELQARGLIRVDEDGGLDFTDTGKAALKYIDTI